MTVDVTIRIAGQAGQGIQSISAIMVNSVATGAAFALLGFDLQLLLDPLLLAIATDCNFVAREILAKQKVDPSSFGNIFEAFK